MIIELSLLVMAAVDTAAMFALHMTAAYGITQLPAQLFDPGSWIFREYRWEHGGEVYQKYFMIKRWKSMLPDGAALFRKGFRKKRVINKRDPEYIALFIRETCRGELAHWIALGVSPVFFIWNPWWAGAIVLLYAVAANIPCIITQRYNRMQLNRILERLGRQAASTTALTGGDGIL